MDNSARVNFGVEDVAEVPEQAAVNSVSHLK